MKASRLMALLAVAGMQITRPQPPTTGGTVEGIVRRADTKEPMAEVSLGLNPHFAANATNAEILESSRKPMPAARTDEKGRFVFMNVPPGKYSLWGEPSGYIWADRNIYPAGGIPVTVTAQGYTGDIVYQLLPRITGSISGRILGVDGNPLVGAIVEVAVPSYSYLDGERRLVSNISTTADHRGEYRLSGLSAKEYYVRTEYHPTTDRDPPLVYYPGTLDETRATRIVVRPGAELTGIDFSLVQPPQVPMFTISGRVVGAPASIAEKPVVAFYLHPHDSKSSSPDRRFTNVASDRSGGQFQIRGVRPGVYDLWPEVFDEPGFAFTSRTALEVTTANVEGVTITVAPGVDLRGRILFNGKPPEGQIEERSRPFVVPLDRVPSPFLEVSPNRIQVNRDTGEFTIRRIPQGKYVAEYYPGSPDAYVADVRQGGLSVVDGFTVGKEAPLPLEILINSPGGVIDGAVFGGDLNPSPGATVVLVSQPYPGRETRWYAETKSYKEGHFNHQGIPPGDYKIYAWMKLPEGSPWQNADFMRRYEAMGQSINVVAGNTASIRVTVIPEEP